MYRQYLHFFWRTTQTPSITNSLVNIVHTKPVIAIVVPKLVAMATSLRTSHSTMSSSDSLTPKPTPRIKLRVASYRTTKVIAHRKPKSQLEQISSQNWLPQQRPLAPVDFHRTYDSLGPLQPATQTASIQPSLQRRPQKVPILYNGTHLPPQNCPYPWEDLDLHLTHGSLDAPKSSTQMASRLVQPFLQGSVV